MAAYLYKALDASGKVVEGIVEAADERGIVAKLKEMSLSPLTVSKKKEAAKEALLIRKKRVTRREITHMTNQLASLLDSKIPLSKALSALENQAANPELKGLMKEIARMVREGKPLSEALADYPAYFNELYRSMVKAGEVGGVLEQSLMRLSDMTQRDEALKSRIKSALTYPMIMLSVMVISIVVLITFVVPRFTGVFADLGKSLPLPTKILVSLSALFAKWWWVAGLMGIIGYVSGRRYIKTEKGRFAFDRMMLNLPVIGKLTREIALSRFAMTLGSLLESGVPVLQAMEATRDVAGNKHISGILEVVKSEVKGGTSFSKAIKEQGALFPDLVAGMIATGEEAGNLPEMLSNMGKYYTQESDAKIKTLTTMLEPLIILVMGVMVGFIILSMLLPIFEMTMMAR